MEFHDWTVRLASRGYGWYLMLKLAKAACLIPCAVGSALILLVAFVFVVTHDFVKSLACIKGLPAEWLEMCDSRWFSGFSRAYYDNLYTDRRQTNSTEPTP